MKGESDKKTLTKKPSTAELPARSILRLVTREEGSAKLAQSPAKISKRQQAHLKSGPDCDNGDDPGPSAA